MIHTFKVHDTFLLYDIESSALMEVDKLVYDILTDSPTLNKDYDSKQIAEARQEIDQLRKDGVIDAPAPANVTISNDSKIVKSICLHVSHDCNLRCKYCFAGTGAYHGERMHMPLDVAKSAVDFLIANSGDRKYLEMDFFGGEPLMNLDVLKATVEYGKQQAKKVGKQFKFTTTTNGVLLNKEIAQYLNQEMDNVVLSLDGRKDINDYHRPTANDKGSFDLIIDNFKYFRSIRGNKSYYLRGTFTAHNTDFCKDVLDMAEQGFDQVSVEPVVLPDNHQLALKDKDLPTLCDNYEQLAIEYVKRRKHSDSWFSFFHYMVDLDNGPCYKKRLVGCGAGGEYLAVTPDGNIYPCHQFAGEKDYLLGNVLDGKLDETKRQMFRDSNLFTKPKCQACWAKYHCSGGCSANAIHFNGDINKPYEFACKLMQKRLECALYVYSKERQND